MVVKILEDLKLVANRKLETEIEEIEKIQKNMGSAISEMGRMATDNKHPFDLYDYFCFVKGVLPALMDAGNEKKRILAEYGLQINPKFNKLNK